MENLHALVGDRRLEKTLSAVSHPSVSIVSFDVFDTLVTRRFWSPSDLFLVMSQREDVTQILSGERFDLARRNAERMVRAEIEPAGKDPTLDQIYDCLSKEYGLSVSQRQRLFDAEVELELCAIVPRTPLRTIWRHAQRLGKETILCSDMYLPSSVIAQMLQRAGYEAPFRMFVSCELGVTKKHGTLFPFVSKEMDRLPGEFLHVGDNLHSDVRVARSAGWKALHIPKLHDHAFQNQKNALAGIIPPFQHNSQIKTFATRTSLKLITEHLFSDQLETKQKGTEMVVSADSLGYSALGPLLLSVTLWMRRLAKQRNQQHLLFLARDGWLPMLASKVIDDCIGKEFESTYLPISRRMIFPWLLSKPNGFEQISHIGFVPGMKVSQFMSERFGAIGTDFFLDTTGSSGERLMGEPLDENFELVLKTLDRNKQNMRSLYNPAASRLENFYRNKIPNDRVTGLFDVGRKGTFQKFLSTIIQRQIHGYYIMTSKEIYNNAPDRNFDFFLGMMDRMANRRNPNTIVYEALLSEQGGTFFDLDDENVPLREDRNLSMTSDESVNQVQSGAMRYIRDAAASFGQDLRLLEQEPFYASYAIENWSQSPGMSRLFQTLLHEDSVSSSKSRSISHALKGVGMDKTGSTRRLVRKLRRLLGA